MLKEKMTQLKMQLKKLKEPTKICKLCFKEFYLDGFKFLANPHYSLCDECYQKLNPKFKTFKILGINCLALYDYNEDTKGLIYRFKGCFDYELKDIFLERYKNELSIKYHDYILVPAPSHKMSDDERGYNHVIEIYSSLNLEFCRCIQKIKKIKQSDRTSSQRMGIKKELELLSTDKITNRKVLIVDDIFTTGSTVRAIIDLIKPLHPKKIEVLVMCKTLDLEDREL